MKYPSKPYQCAIDHLPEDNSNSYQISKVEIAEENIRATDQNELIQYPISISVIGEPIQPYSKVEPATDLIPLRSSNSCVMRPRDDNCGHSRISTWQIISSCLKYLRDMGNCFNDAATSLHHESYNAIPYWDEMGYNYT